LTYATQADKAPRLQGVNDPVAGRLTFLYDTNGRTKTWLDALGRRSTVSWDGSGNRLALQVATGQRTSYVSTSQGQVAGVVNPLLQRQTMVYDGQGQKAADVNGLGQRTSYSFNASGQVVRVQNPLGQITTLLRDQANRITVQIDPLGRRETKASGLQPLIDDHVSVGVPVEQLDSIATAIAKDEDSPDRNPLSGRPLSRPLQQHLSS
jgi:YD repeat-containing protein